MRHKGDEENCQDEDTDKADHEVLQEPHKVRVAQASPGLRG